MMGSAFPVNSLMDRVWVPEDGLVPACSVTDPELFFPDHKAGMTKLARIVCNGCELQSRCLEAALEQREQHGFWGGLSPGQRRSLLRAREAETRRSDWENNRGLRAG